MAEFPSVPLWTDSYLADTAARITVEEHAAYLLLIQLAWREGNDAKLPPKDDCILWLKGVCKGMHGRTANRLVETVLNRFWTQDENGDYFQKRLQKEWKHVRNTSETRSKHARKRWAKSKENKDIGDAKAYAPTPTPTPIIRKKDSSSPSATESDLLGRVNGRTRHAYRFDEFWACWNIPGTKKERAAAESKYRAAIKSDRVTHDQLCAGVSRYMRWCKAERKEVRYIKAPATWLNKGCWDDDLVRQDRPAGKPARPRASNADLANIGE